MKTLVTTYTNPDIDGTACSYAYAEFLTKHKEDATAAVFGKPLREVDFVLKTFNIPNQKNADNIITKVQEIILVDTSSVKGLSPKIELSKVKEVIDHREVTEAHAFKNAKIQIELVGSAATLIAEKFHKSKTLISKESAALLFSAIISNTVNFQAKVTTQRDKNMAKWLKTQFTCPEYFVRNMFADKSQLSSLKNACQEELKEFEVNKTKIGISQLELVGVEEFVNKNKNELIKIIKDLQKEKAIENIFLTCVDIEKAYNVLLATEKTTQRFLEKAMQVKFTHDIAKTNKIFMRKEIVPLLKEVIESGH
jgi:inorganic pyrophosphatase/exopolyphosphatase